MSCCYPWVPLYSHGSVLCHALCARKHEAQHAACKPPNHLTSALLSASAQEDTSNALFTVRLTHPELLARIAVQGRQVEHEEQQQDEPPHGERRQEHEREQQQQHGGSASAAAVHVEQRLASLPVVIPIPIPVPSADAPHHSITITTSSTSSSPAQAAPAPQQQQLQQHTDHQRDALRQHPTQHTHHPYLHQLLLPPHLVQSLPQPTTVYVHWTGARHVAGSPSEPSSSSASPATSSQTHAPAPALGPAHSSWRDAFSQLLTHSRAATQVGVTVVRVAGAPALVALYVPPVAAPAASVPVQGVSTAGQAARETSEDPRVIGATVYVIDLLAVPQPGSAEAAAAEAEAAGGAGQGQGEGQAGGGLEAYTCAVLTALRGVLEDGRVAKVVHGAQQVGGAGQGGGGELKGVKVVSCRSAGSMGADLRGTVPVGLPGPWAW